MHLGKTSPSSSQLICEVNLSAAVMVDKVIVADKTNASSSNNRRPIHLSKWSHLKLRWLTLRHNSSQVSNRTIRLTFTHPRTSSQWALLTTTETHPSSSTTTITTMATVAQVTSHTNSNRQRIRLIGMMKAALRTNSNSRVVEEPILAGNLAVVLQCKEAEVVVNKAISSKSSHSHNHKHHSSHNIRIRLLSEEAIAEGAAVDEAADKEAIMVEGALASNNRMRGAVHSMLVHA